MFALLETALTHPPPGIMRVFDNLWPRNLADVHMDKFNRHFLPRMSIYLYSGKAALQNEKRIWRALDLLKRDGFKKVLPSADFEYGNMLEDAGISMPDPGYLYNRSWPRVVGATVGKLFGGEIDKCMLWMRGQTVLAEQTIEQLTKKCRHFGIFGDSRSDCVCGRILAGGIPVIEGLNCAFAKSAPLHICFSPPLVFSEREDAVYIMPYGERPQGVSRGRVVNGAEFDFPFHYEGPVGPARFPGLVSAMAEYGYIFPSSAMLVSLVCDGGYI